MNENEITIPTVSEDAAIGWRFGRDKAEFGRSSENVQDSVFRGVLGRAKEAGYGETGREAGDDYRKEYRQGLRMEAGERASAEFDALGSDNARRKAFKEWKRNDGAGLLNNTAYLIAAWFGTAPRFSESLGANDTAEDDENMRHLIDGFLSGSKTAQDVKSYKPETEDDEDTEDDESEDTIESVTDEDTIEDMLRRTIAQAREVLGEAKVADILAEELGVTAEVEAES